MTQRYVAQWNYRSSYGQFAKGDVLVIEPEEAAQFNQDSPGVLAPEESTSAVSPAVEGRAGSTPQDRMFHGQGAQNRAAGAESAEAPVEATEAAEKLAEEEGVDLEEVEGTGQDGRVLVADVEAAAEPDATDAARELAAEHGIDLGQVKGTGKDGRIILSDVEALVE